jgi:hypothetical protein
MESYEETIDSVIVSRLFAHHGLQRFCRFSKGDIPAISAGFPGGEVSEYGGPRSCG